MWVKHNLFQERGCIAWGLVMKLKILNYVIILLFLFTDLGTNHYMRWNCFCWSKLQVGQRLLVEQKLPVGHKSLIGEMSHVGKDHICLLKPDVWAWLDKSFQLFRRPCLYKSPELDKSPFSGQSHMLGTMLGKDFQLGKRSCISNFSLWWFVMMN